MTRLLDKLEELNFIKRNRYVTNRRLIEVAITLQGFAKLKSMAAEVRKCNREQLGQLSKGKLKSLIDRVRRFASAEHFIAANGERQQLENTRYAIGWSRSWQLRVAIDRTNADATSRG